MPSDGTVLPAQDWVPTNGRAKMLTRARVTAKRAEVGAVVTVKAKVKLQHVAEALEAQAGNERMVVEGHTDSQGADTTNQPLSLNRATAVRDYLVSRGVASEKITSVGLGSSKPMTDNETAEGRANDRRVEIVIGVAGLTAR